MPVALFDDAAQFLKSEGYKVKTVYRVYQQLDQHSGRGFTLVHYTDDTERARTAEYREVVRKGVKMWEVVSWDGWSEQP